MQTSPSDILKRHDLRKTEVRMKVLEIFLGREEALSHALIEGQFEKIDRITLYRTLRTFEEKGIIHKALDSTNTAKYALCSHSCPDHEHVDSHAHFHCDYCGRTFCLEDINTPPVKGLKGFRVMSANLIMEGICSDCIGKRSA